MDKRYDSKATEQEMKDFWDKNEVYLFQEGSDKESYTIDTPPPTVSGRMHVGHAFSYTQGDIIARYKRMAGYNVFFPFGTDDNGLATEKLVEKLNKVSSKNMSREEFIELCQKTLEKEVPGFVQDWIDIGISANFKNPYSTISDSTRKISQQDFLELYKKGRIYREESPISWCPTCQTGIAQAEFESKERTAKFNDIAFKYKDKELVISTTRPELLPACVALCAHPSDKRYDSLKGKFVKVPLFEYDVPIIFDETVDMEKGTGLMMVCTFGDKEDIEKWHKHKLPLKTIVEKDGRLSEKAKPYNGLKIEEARKKIIEDLEKEGLLKSQVDIVNSVNLHERCDTPIEFLKTKQWFVKVLDKKQELIEAGEKVNWHPEFMKKRYIHWVENLNWDWCISRQRYFGIQIPVWYSKKTGEVILPEEDELPVDPMTDKPKNLPKDHTYEDIISEEDVLDTWNTSGLTPHIAIQGKNLGMPMDLRQQAHDIIRTWAFYTITKNHYKCRDIPWKNVMVSGFVLDPKGNKMSKSKGNTVQPQKVVEEHGSDAIRYWTAGSKLGEDMPYSEKDVVTGKKTANKLWNATRFAFMNLEGFKPKPLKEYRLEVLDKWIVTKLMKTAKKAGEGMEEFDFAKARHSADYFFWHNLCNNYLEFIKHRVYNEEATSAKGTLYHCIYNSLKLFAPIMPFVTDKIYQEKFREYEGIKSIHIASWPTYDEELVFENEERAGDLAVDIVTEVRKYKSENKLSLKDKVEKVTVTLSEEDLMHSSSVEDEIKKIVNIRNIEFEEGDDFRVDIDR